MTRTYHRWYSQSLHRDMETLVFGHGGAPVIVFPSSMGAFFEYEDRGMVAAVGDKLEHGALQLLCVSSVDSESWYNSHVHPRHRIERHLQYEHYILNDVVPLARHLNPHHEGLGVTGCSFGAYHAMTLALRYPELFTSCITMGGRYDNASFLDGYDDTDGYLLSPLRSLPRLDDPRYLDPIRRNKFVLATGEHDICRGANEEFSGVLHAKGIPHALHVWGSGSKHDWPDWRPMAAAYLP
ncbi:MAG: alpha/beta hydrolase-fold protein [Vicinamibacterales bacterium]|nr:alpha/beta hydrolase-fold protein [Vicinamibacterales bacterium]